jgi:DNA repair exonuclease SbcCD ATPase subunit
VKVLRVNPTGFFSYGEHPPVEFDRRGVVLLQGSVGAGKSSLFNALTEILFGMSPQREGTRSVTESNIVNVRLGRAFGHVDLEVRGHYYRVIYCRGWKGPAPLAGPSAQQAAGAYTGTSLWFERWDGAQWVQRDHDGQDLRFARMQDTWAKIADVIGMDFGLFCDVAYVAQDRALRFIRGRNQDREEIITRIKRLGVYDEAEQRARERRDASQQEVGRLGAVVDALVTEERSIEVSDTAALESRVQEARRQFDSAREALQRSERACEERRLAVDQRDALSGEQQRELDEVVQQIHRETAGAEAIRSGVERERQAAAVAISKLPTSTAEIDALQHRRTSVRAVLDAERHRLMGLLGEAGRCPACGTVVTDETLARHRAEQQAVIDDAARQLDDVGASLSAHVAEHAQRSLARRAEIETARDARVEAIEKSAADRLVGVVRLEGRKWELQQRLAAASESSRAVMQAFQEASRDVGLLRQQADRWALEGQSAEQQLEFSRFRDARRASVSSRRAEQEGLRDAAQLDQQEWAWLVRHYPRVKQLKFASVSSDLNGRLAYWLGILTDGVRVVLSPFRVKKESVRKPVEARTADDYVFEFDMVVEEPGKVGVPIELYSGGERELVTLAIVAAFWELAAGQGAGTNVLFLDETITYLDEGSIERTVRVIEELRRRVDTIVAVGHDPALRNLLRPDEVWYARKLGGSTTLEIVR